MVISKLFKFTVHRDGQDTSKRATRFQNFSSLQFILLSINKFFPKLSISKLFKFTVHTAKKAFGGLIDKYFKTFQVYSS